MKMDRIQAILAPVNHAAFRIYQNRHVSTYRCVQKKCNILQDDDQDHLKHEHIEAHVLVHDVNEACEHANDVSLHAKRTGSAAS